MYGACYRKLRISRTISQSDYFVFGGYAIKTWPRVSRVIMFTNDFLAATTAPIQLPPLNLL